MPTTIRNDFPTSNPFVRGNYIMDRSPTTGILWIVLRASSGTNEVWHSTNDGVNWTNNTANNVPIGGHGSLFIDSDGNFHYLRIAGSGYGYRRGTVDSTGTVITWGAQLQVWSPTGSTAVTQQSNCVAHEDGVGGWKVHCIGNFIPSAGTTRLVHYERLSVSSNGVITNDGVGTDIWTQTGSDSPGCAIDFRHTGDGKTAHATPNLYVVYGGGSVGLLFKKGTYSAGTWSWGTERVLDAAAGGGFVQMHFDGTRIVTFYSNTGVDELQGVERDEADTANTSRDPPAMSDGTINGWGASYKSNGDIYVMGFASTSLDPKWVKYNRAGATWGSWAVIESGNSQGGAFAGLRNGEAAVAYPLVDGSNYDARFERFSLSPPGDALLQGAATVEGTASVGQQGDAILQGAGTLSSSGAVGVGGLATLQGVGTLSMTSLLIPKKDFTVYDGYLDSPASGTLPLIYFEDESAKPQTTSRPLRPPRTDVGTDPTEVRPESGEIFSQQDFSHGSGQLYFHHEGRDVRRFLWSEGFEVEIDTVGQPTLLHHLNDVPTAATTSASIGKIEVFNDSPFVIDGANIKKGSGDFPGFWLNENPGGTPQDMVSSGEFLYAALGAAGIARRDTSGAWSIWNASVLATRIAWVKNRIMASDGANTYEITDSTRTVETLPAGWIFEAIFEAGGFIYAVANNASSGLSRISTYGLNSAGDALEKKNETPFPRNQLMYSGRGFLGSVYIGGGIKNSVEGFDPVVYQAFPQDSGALTYLKVSEGEGAGPIDLSVKAFEPIGEDIVFGWSLGSGFDFGARDGLAIHKPRADAFLGYLKKTGAGAGRQVLGIALFRGRLLFTLKGDGLYYEDTTHLVSQAQLWTSVADWQTTTKKAWDLIQISHNRLPADTTVRAEYSTRLPNEGVWNPGVLSDVDNSEVAEAGFTDVTSQMLSLRLTSTANTAKTEAPSGLGFLVRSNVIPDHPEFGLTRYVRLINKDRKDHDAPEVFTDVAAVRRKMHSLAYRWVTLYEPGVIWTLHVDSIAEVQPFLVEYDATLGEGQAQGYVMQFTMTGTRD